MKSYNNNFLLKNALVFCFLVFFIFISYNFLFATEKQKIKDMAGRQVSISSDVKKIIAVGPGVLRFVTYLEAVDKIAGIERLETRQDMQTNRPYSIVIGEKVKNLPVFSEGGPGKLPDIEKIMMIKPDVVFILGIETSQVDAMQAKTGIPFVVVSYSDFGAFRKQGMESLVLMGKILKKEKRAGELIDFYNKCSSELIERTKNIKSKPGVYVGGMSYKGVHGITSTDADFPPFNMVNAVNVAAETGKKSHIFIDQEVLLTWQPDYLFLDSNSLPIIKDDLQKNPVFYKGIKAINDKKTFSIISYNAYNTNVELLLANAYFIGKTLHPNEFKDIDPIKKADEIMKFFLGMPVYEKIKGEKENRGFGEVVFEGNNVFIR